MQYVCNPAGILSQAACDSIDSMLYALEQQTGIETVVAVVPSIGEEDCFNFCHQLLNKWGVGKKDKNNGLVILLVTDQRCIQFYTGYGLEGVLPDAICKRIQTRYMIPYLKDGNWDAGMVAGLKATCQRLDGSMENDALSDSNSGGSFDFVLAILCFIAIGGGLAFFSARKQNIVSYVFMPILCKRISAPYNLDRSYCTELIFLVKTQTLSGFIDVHLLFASYHGLFSLSKKLPCQSDTGARYFLFPIFHCGFEQFHIKFAGYVLIQTVSDTFGVTHLTQYTTIGRK